MRYFTDERYEGSIISLIDLKKEYDNKILLNEYEGTFTDYITECTSKNGTLTEIK